MPNEPPHVGVRPVRSGAPKPPAKNAFPNDSVVRDRKARREDHPKEFERAPKLRPEDALLDRQVHRDDSVMPYSRGTVLGTGHNASAKSPAATIFGLQAPVQRNEASDVITVRRKNFPLVRAWRHPEVPSGGGVPAQRPSPEQRIRFGLTPMLEFARTFAPLLQ